MVCANCKKQYEDATVCPNCGAPAKMRSSYPYPEAEKPEQRKGFFKRLFGKKD